MTSERTRTEAAPKSYQTNQFNIRVVAQRKRANHLSEIGTSNNDLAPGGGAENALGKGGSKRVLQKPVHVESKGTAGGVSMRAI